MRLGVCREEKRREDVKSGKGCDVFIYVEMAVQNGAMMKSKGCGVYGV